MPAPRRAILTDITDRGLDPNKRHELDKSGRLVDKKSSPLEEVKVKLEVQTVVLESKEETVLQTSTLSEQKCDVVSNDSEETTVDSKIKECVVSDVEPDLQLFTEKPKGRFKPKKKAQSDS